MNRSMKPAPDLRELRLLASRYGVPLEVVDRLTLRPHEIARATGFSRLTVRKWINSGELEVIEAPGGLAVTVVDLVLCQKLAHGHAALR